MANNLSGNGPKAFGGIVAIVALLAGMAAIVRPMNQSIAALERRLDAHAALAAHPTAAKATAMLGEKFQEVETQFKALRELTDVRFQRFRAENGIMGRHNFQQFERLRALETQIVRLGERLKATQREK